MSLTKAEQETGVNFLPGEDVQIYSAFPPHVRRLRKRVEEGRATLIREDEDSITVSVPAGQFDPTKGFKTQRTLSPEQRQAASDRMRKARSFI